MNTAGERSLFASAFGGAKLTKRIEGVLSYKRLTWLSAAAFGVLFLVIAYILVTD